MTLESYQQLSSNRVFKNLLIISLFFFLISSCNQVDKRKDLDNVQSILLDPNANEKNGLFDLIENVELIPMSNITDFNFKSLTRGTSGKEYYFFAENISGGNIIVTSKQGEVIKRINWQGDGPKEYKELTSFSFNDVENSIMIYDFLKQRINYYDIEGNYLRSNKIGVYAKSVTETDSFLYTFSAKHVNLMDSKKYTSNLLILNPKTGSVINSYIDFIPEYYESMKFFNLKPFHSIEDGILFNDLLSDTVYMVSRDSVKSTFYFEYVNDKLPPHLQNDDQLLYDQLIENRDNLMAYDFHAVVNAATDEFILYSYFHKMKKYFGVFLINDRISREFEMEFNDPLRILDPFFVDNNHCITIIDQYKLEFLESQINNVKYQYVLDKIKDIRLRHNDPEHPIMMTYDIRR